MANETKLEVYTIKVRERGKKKNVYPPENFLGRNDFLTFFQEYIKSFDQQLELNEDQKKSLKLASDTLSFSASERTISGVIESGDYGYTGTGINIKTGDKSYDRTVDDTEIKPFYFLLYIPRKRKVGFVILQRIGVYGIHSVFKKHLNNFFESRFANLKLDFDQFVSKELARAFVEKGNIKEITFVKNNLPADIAEKVGLKGYQREIKSLELKIKAKSRLAINDKAAKFMNDPNTSFFEVETLESLGFDGDHKIKVKSKFNGNTRTVDLSETGQIRPYYDIDGDIKKNKDGHPVFESIDKIAKELIKELTS
nr:hypothetical protein [uncultured Allomuricauda sp.]